MKSTTEQKLQDLLAFAKEHHLTEVVWQENDVRIAFRRGAPSLSATPATSAPAVAEEEKKSNEVVVTSPIVGTFHRSISKTRPPLVMEGGMVKPGDRLGIVECMKIPTDVTSISEGRIQQIFVEDGQAVEYGQPLFSIAPGENNRV